MKDHVIRTLVAVLGLALGPWPVAADTMEIQQRRPLQVVVYDLGINQGWDSGMKLGDAFGTLPFKGTFPGSAELQFTIPQPQASTMSQWSDAQVATYKDVVKAALRPRLLEAIRNGADCFEIQLIEDVKLTDPQDSVGKFAWDWTSESRYGLLGAQYRAGLAGVAAYAAVGELLAEIQQRGGQASINIRAGSNGGWVAAQAAPVLAKYRDYIDQIHFVDARATSRELRDAIRLIGPDKVTLMVRDKNDYDSWDGFQHPLRWVANSAKGVGKLLREFPTLNAFELQRMPTNPSGADADGIPGPDKPRKWFGGDHLDAIAVAERLVHAYRLVPGERPGRPRLEDLGVMRNREVFALRTPGAMGTPIASAPYGPSERPRPFIRTDDLGPPPPNRPPLAAFPPCPPSQPGCRGGGGVAGVLVDGPIERTPGAGEAARQLVRSRPSPIDLSWTGQ